MPWVAGGAPMVMEVRAAAVVDGATVVIGPPSMAAMVGARPGRSWSWAQPTPSNTNRTTWEAPTAGAGNQAGLAVGAPSGPPARAAATTWSMHAPP